MSTSCTHNYNRTAKGDRALLAITQGDLDHPDLAPMLGDLRARFPDVSDDVLLASLTRVLTRTCRECRA